MTEEISKVILYYYQTLLYKVSYINYSIYYSLINSHTQHLYDVQIYIFY